MTPSLRWLVVKETRALLPAWCAAAAAVVLCAFTFVRYGPLVYVYGCFVLGASTIGHEYTHRTLSLMLVQPLDRHRVFAVKLATTTFLLLGLATIAAWLAFPALEEFGSDGVLLIALPPIGALTIGPWLTMVCRNPLAGALFSGVPPAVLFLAARWYAIRTYGTDEGAAADLLIRQIWFATLGVLAPTAAVLGWRKFANLEVIEGADRAIELPRVFARRTAPRVHHPVWHHVLKELRLQQLAFMMMLLFVAGCLWGIYQVSRQALAVDVLNVLAPIYVGGVAMLIGALASAEERQLGTLQSELMLPAPVWRPWAIKCAVALALALTFGIAVPMLVFSLAPFAVNTRMFWPQALLPLLVMTAIGIYVSSLSSSGVRAMTWAFPAVLVAFYFAQSVQTVVGAVGLVPAPLRHRPAMAVASAALLIGMLLWLAYINHRTLERRPTRVVRQVAALLAAIVAGVVLS